MRTAKQWLEIVLQTTRKLGPYALMEVVLPGGTMFALALFLYRNPEVARRYWASVRVTALALAGSLRTVLATHMPSIPLTAGIETAVRALG